MSLHRAGRVSEPWLRVSPHQMSWRPLAAAPHINNANPRRHAAKCGAWPEWGISQVTVCIYPHPGASHSPCASWFDKKNLLERVVQMKCLLPPPLHVRSFTNLRQSCRNQHHHCKEYNRNASTLIQLYYQGYLNKGLPAESFQNIVPIL